MRAACARSSPATSAIASIVEFEGDALPHTAPNRRSEELLRPRRDSSLRNGGDAQGTPAKLRTPRANLRFELVEPSLEEIFIQTVGGRPMRNMLLIAKREYLEQVRSRAFQMTTMSVSASSSLMVSGSSRGEAWLGQAPGSRFVRSGAGREIRPIIEIKMRRRREASEVIAHFRGRARDPVSQVKAKSSTAPLG